MSVVTPGTHFGDDRAARQLTREVNEFGADLRCQHPTRFGHFASLPLPDVEGALAETAYALDELGAEGLTVATNAHGRYLGDEPVRRRCDRAWHRDRRRQPDILPAYPRGRCPWQDDRRATPR